jgi:O-antigen ligase
MIATVASISGIPYILSILKGRMIEHEDPAVSFKAFASVALCLIPAMLWAGRLIGGQWKAISYICVALAVVVIWATGNRASLAGLMCMWLTVALLYTLRHQKSWIKLVVLSSITLSIIAIVLFHWNTRIYNLETSYLPEWLVDPHRQQIWRFAFERFLESPLVGNGMDQLNNIPGAHDPAFGLPKNAALVPSHPHNWLLEVLSEAGLVGLLPMIGVICMIFWQKALAYVQKGDVQALALCAVLSGFWSSALFNFSIWAAWWLLTLFTVYAIISIFRETSR